MGNNQLSAQQQHYILPNGLSVLQQNKYETDFMYKEIFEKHVYHKHGIKINNRDCIFDIGSNIGLFIIYIQQISTHTKVYAFEPSPELYKILHVNTAQYGPNVKISQCGISNENKEAVFSFYPGYSILSGFYADIDNDYETLQSCIRNQLRNTNPKQSDSEDETINLLTKRMLSQKKEHICRLRTISSIIDEHRVHNIDLLKIDAEQSELDVLQGIHNGDWGKIKQIVMEVHDTNGSVLTQIKHLLKSKGFRIKVEKNEQFINSGIINIYAILN